MTDKGKKPSRGFVSDQAWDSVNELVNIYNSVNACPACPERSEGSGAEGSGAKGMSEHRQG